MDALSDKTNTVKPDLEVFGGAEIDLQILYQKIGCHAIWDVKLGKNFRRKAGFLAGGHTATTPMSFTYSSVVSRDLVSIALTSAVMKELDILVCEITGA